MAICHILFIAHLWQIHLLFMQYETTILKNYSEINTFDLISFNLVLTGLRRP